MKILVRSLVDDKKYIIDVETEDIIPVENEPPIGFVKTIKSHLDRLETEIDDVSSEISKEYEDYLNVISSGQLENIYRYANKRYVLTRFESVKEFSDTVRKFIETINGITNELDLFTYDKKITLLNNLKEIAESLGYKFEVTDFTIDNNIEIILSKSDDIIILKITDSDYDRIESDNLLSDLLKPDTIVLLLSDDKKKVILNKLERLFSV